MLEMGISSVVWTNLNGWKSQKSLKLQQAVLSSWQQLVICMQKATAILHISCPEWTISITCNNFPRQMEQLQKTSNYKKIFFFLSLPSSSFLITGTCQELKLWFQKIIVQWFFSDFCQRNFRKRKAMQWSTNYTMYNLTDTTADEIVWSSWDKNV